MGSERVTRAEEFKRETRADESRRLEARILELRDKPTMNANNPLYVDPAIIPPGWTYAWIRYSLVDIPDYKRELETKRNGWTPVPSDRHPELSNDGASGRTG